MRRLLTILLCTLFFCLDAGAQDVQAKQDEKQRIEKEIEFIDNQLKGLTRQQKATTKHLSLIRKKASNRRTLIKSLDSKLNDLDMQIAAREEQISDLKTELDTLTAYYNKLIYNCYKNRDTKVWFMYVLASEDIGQGYRRLRYLKNLSDAVNRQGVKIQETSAELEREKAELEEARKEASLTKSKREKEYKSLLAEEKESKQVISKISGDRKKYQKELAKKRREVENLNREIRRILDSAVKNSGKHKQSAAEVALTGEFAQNKGKLGWPVRTGVISEHFGVHYHPVYKNIKLPENNGITIVTARDAEVYSVFKGVVKQIIVMPGYNHCVLVQHGGYYTFYCKLRSVSVKAGQLVEAGTVLGRLEPEDNGSTIHFQIWKGTSKQDPESWLR